MSLVSSHCIVCDTDIFCYSPNIIEFMFIKKNVYITVHIHITYVYVTVLRKNSLIAGLAKIVFFLSRIDKNLLSLRKWAIAQITYAGNKAGFRKSGHIWDSKYKI